MPLPSVLLPLPLPLPLKRERSETRRPSACRAAALKKALRIAGRFL